MAGVDAARFSEVQAPSYGDDAYWSERYGEECEPYDWYLTWDQLKEALQPLLTPESEILVMGCGTSTLSEKLYTEGYVNVTNVDRCEQVLSAMRDRHTAMLEAPPDPKAKKDPKAKVEEPAEGQEKKPMVFEALAAQSLPQAWAGRFDVVIDKALLDAVACGKDKWRQADSVLRSVSAVLKPQSGVYVCLSHARPEVRRPMLLNIRRQDAIKPQGSEEADVSGSYQWRLEHQPLPRPMMCPAADPKAKEKMEIVPSASYNAEEHVYHLYMLRKL